ncbi:MAG TPA: type I restriction endonuclease, partial [Candidatus Kapabacteria bacterium]|nr:type I restriction endonuclease [Candidatus Kapabacteria bacterium]
MTKNYLEENFENHIEEHLLNSGYRKKLSQDYDKDLCLIPTETIQFIKAAQPNEFQNLQKQYGPDVEQKLLQRLAKQIDQNGAIHVLRNGFKDRGQDIKLTYFKPASGMNPTHHHLYSQNRFTVIRQLYYSRQSNPSIDMVLFLNGIPLITIELKNSLTGQLVDDAIVQYKNRNPQEPLFQFKRCPVHFAVGNEKIFMTTHLKGPTTRFLPFNRDTENPINPDGHKTAYLWEDILHPQTLMNLIDNYLHVQIKEEKDFDPKTKIVKEHEYEEFIFPRFHQLEVVRELLDAVKQEGPGRAYLVQHSAGSGKSNSIAWLSHQLAGLFRTESDHQRLFDSIIVVTDRRILDRQLQKTIKQFQRIDGVVHPIDKNSQQLKETLQQGKSIIITTLQKFPVISESISQLPGKKFAVIIDEAHSSQSGESTKHMKQVLSSNLEKAEADDHVEFDVEDETLKEIR